MAKRFKPVIPSPMQPAYDGYKYAPAVIAGNQIHISGLLGLGEDGSVPDDYAQQVENIFGLMELVLAEAGATLADVFSMTSYHVGDLPRQMPDFIRVKTERLGEPHPAWTAIGVSQLALEGAQIEVSVIAFAPTL